MKFRNPNLIFDPLEQSDLRIASNVVPSNQMAATWDVAIESTYASAAENAEIEAAIAPYMLDGTGACMAAFMGCMAGQRYVHARQLSRLHAMGPLVRAMTMETVEQPDGV